MSSLDRREFLTQSTLAGAAAGLALAGQATPARAAANEKVVVGIMGLSRGAALADHFAKLKESEIKYLCDVDRERLAKCAKAVEQVTGRSPELITDFRKILDDKSVDALVCAAPNHWHAPATILACKAGKHVYVEKPCSHNPREGELMVEAARKYQRAVQMGTQRRSGVGTREAIKRLQEGAIGRIYLVRAWYNSARGSIGQGKPAQVPSNLDYDLWQGPAPRRDYLDNLVHYNWHWRWHWGNGELGNNGVHTLDLCRWGLGVDYPVRVTSSGGRYCYDDDQETPDTQTVAYEFEGKRMITWEGMSCHRRQVAFILFYGEKGTLDLESDGHFTIYDDKDKEVSKFKSPGLGHVEHVVNFLNAIRDGKPLALNTEIAEGYKSTLLCHLGNIAQRTGRALTCDPANGHILNDPQAMQFWSREYEKKWEPSV